MRSLFLVFCLLFAGFAGASGSNTVFQKLTRYYVTSDLAELSTNPGLSPYLESLDRQILVVKVERNSWLKTIEMLRLGKQVYIQFGDNYPIAFYYNSNLKIAYGQTRYGDIVILDPCDYDEPNYRYPNN
ncbi:MAG: hypothetical protein ACOH5I_19925 [Oligoflexus sp.]